MGATTSRHRRRPPRVRALYRSPGLPLCRGRRGRSVPPRRAARFTRTHPQARNSSIFQGFSARLSPAHPATLRDNASSGEPKYPVHQVGWTFWFTEASRRSLGASAFLASPRGHLRARRPRPRSPRPSPEITTAVFAGRFLPESALCGPRRGESARERFTARERV